MTHLEYNFRVGQLFKSQRDVAYMFGYESWRLIWKVSKSRATDTFGKIA